MKCTVEAGEEFHVNIVIADPDHLVTQRPTKRHAIKFEISQGHWQVLMLSDRELVDLGSKIFDRWERTVFYGN